MYKFGYINRLRNTILEGTESTDRREIDRVICHIFHSCTVHVDTIKVFYLSAEEQKNCFKRILKCTLKELLHVSVQSQQSGSVLFELC